VYILIGDVVGIYIGSHLIDHFLIATEVDTGFSQFLIVVLDAIGDVT
jgi:hypothetical protein